MPERRRFGRPLEPQANEPDISEMFKRAVEEAIRWAWQKVRVEFSDIVEAGDEEEITNRMQMALNQQGPDHRRLAPGLGLFETVGRGSKVVSNDATLNKAPDLTFRPIEAFGVRDLGAWGVFVECKIIGPGHHSPDAYCRNGVARFVSGAYAPRMPSAMMVAYVRDRRLPYPTLSPLLKDIVYKMRTHESIASDLSRSVHDRDALAPPCADIALTHLWLDVTAQ